MAKPAKPVTSYRKFSPDDALLLKEILSQDQRAWRFNFEHDGEQIHAEWNGFAVADWPSIWKRGKWIDHESLPFTPLLVSPSRLDKSGTTLHHIEKALKYIDKQGIVAIKDYNVAQAKATYSSKRQTILAARGDKAESKEMARAKGYFRVPAYITELVREVYPSPARGERSPSGMVKVLTTPRRVWPSGFIMPNLVLPKFFGHEVAIFLRKPSEEEYQILDTWTKNSGRFKHKYLVVEADKKALTEGTKPDQFAESQRVVAEILSHLKQIEAKSCA